MTTLLVQEKAATNNNSNPATVTLDAPATAGNILFCVVASNHNALTSFTAPTGFTIPTDGQMQTASNQAGIAIAYKEAVGGETAISWTSDRDPDNYSWDVWVGEYSGLTGATPHVAVINNTSGFSTVQTLSTGTSAATTAANTFSIAAWVTDADNPTVTSALYSNSFTEEHQDTTGTTLFVATKSHTTTGTVETTLTHDGAAENMGSLLLTWEESVVTASVDDINTNEIILDAQQNNTYEVSGFSGSITGITLTNGTRASAMTGITED